MPDRISIEITARDDASPVIEKAKKAFDELEKSLADSKQSVSSVQETFDKASSAVAAFEQRIESSADIVRNAGAQYALVAASIGRDFGGNLAQTVRDSVLQIPAMMEGLGRDSTQMFARGMSSALGEVGKSASSIAGVISDYLELHSPAKKALSRPIRQFGQKSSCRCCPQGSFQRRMCLRVLQKNWRACLAA